MRRALACGFGCLLAVGAQAQEKAKFDPSLAQNAKLPLPSPYDKLLAIQEAIGNKNVRWSEVYNAVAVDVDPNKLDSRADLALALGVKIADGILSVKSQNIENLNTCADQIEALAKKLGATDDDLRRARAVRENANKEKWLNVFLELGFLQTDIMKILNEKGTESERTLIVAAGWMQGARHVTYLIAENYTPDLSNILREPLLVGALEKDLKSLPAKTKADPKVAALLNAYPQALVIVDVKRDEAISKENVGKLKSIADKAIGAVQN
ncbi:MAG: hypothetical protein PHC88_12960 [Terrimicrobiaceae bacterium]|nr:hypothetical protein [Terrimicrobiaceae bacterium]